MKALIKNIKVTERVRKEITKIEELAADISAYGLINPITVMSVGDDEFRLLAGLRRLRAVESMGLDEIDVNVVEPSDAEMQLRIEISENEQREPFTFSEKMNFARLLEEIEKAKAKERRLAGKKFNADDLTPLGAEGQKGETRAIVADKIGMGKTNYDRAKYIADNAPEKIIDELDRGERKIRPTYDELKAKEKAQEAAVERNNRFRALSPDEKVVELQRQIKEARARACTAEADLARLKELRHNDVYHRDGIIANLKMRLENAEARVQELERLYCPDAVSTGSQINDVIPLY